MEAKHPALVSTNLNVYYYYYYYYYYHHHYYCVIDISVMQGVYIYIPETNHVPRDTLCCSYSGVTIHGAQIVSSCVDSFSMLALSEVCVQCPVWLFSVVP